MPGAGSLAKCQCCCVDRLCSRGENRGTAPQLDGAVRHEPCRTAFSRRRAKSRRSYRAAARLSRNLVAFAPAGAKKVQSFSSATCAAKKILLRLQVWNLCAGGAQIMRVADCTPPCQKVILFDSLKKPPLRSERRFAVFLFGQLACGCTARRTSGSSDGSSSENTTAFAAQMPRRSGSVPKTNTGE